MKVSTKGRYALRVMIDLACSEKDKYISLTDIAKRQEVSNKYLEQIISMLLKANLIDSCRGKMGGYKLNREPKDYSVGEILRATEGKMIPIECVDNGGETCPRIKICKTYAFWEGFNKAISDYIDGTTLEDLMR